MPLSYKYALATYQQMQRQCASPRQRLIAIYSEAITACFNEDFERVQQSLTALQLSLKHDTFPALTAYLHGILAYCRQLGLNKEYLPIANALIALRDSMFAD